MDDNVYPPQETPSFVIAFGNPFEGITLRGPFNSFEEAEEYASRTTETEWLIATLYSPIEP